MRYLVVTIKDWNIDEYQKYSKEFQGDWHLITNKEDLTLINLKKIEPKYIFFPHWSWAVPKEITDNYECVCFHMTDLPYGRGGSPLQNLIIRGRKETQITALKMTQEMDAGDIYKKSYLDLSGSAQEIFIRASKKIVELINFIIMEEPNPIEQKGTVTNFQRRALEQSQIPEGLSLKEMYDYIRMLDAPGYPKAFLEVNGYRLEFKNSEYADGRLSAKVSFIKREGDV